jgi:RNA polymerase sigma factor (TIGR02999 family)
VSASPSEDVTRLLAQIGAGEQPTAELMSALYTELRSIADGLMRGERGNHTLQPTALVNEAFLRLVDSEKIGTQGRLRFLDAAAVTMRRVLVDHARRVGAQKRGGGAERVSLEGLQTEERADDIDLIALETALEKLGALDPRQAKIVELRFFSGMSGQEIAEHTGVSRNTVVRELTMARAWLRGELGGDAPGDRSDDRSGDAPHV